MAKKVKSDESKAEVIKVGEEIQETKEEMAQDNLQAIGQVALPGTGKGTIVKK